MPPQLHELANPAKDKPLQGKFSYVYGYLLEVGDTLRPTDVYAGMNGYWEKCPVPGAVIRECDLVKWVRPS